MQRLNKYSIRSISEAKEMLNEIYITATQADDFYNLRDSSCYRHIAINRIGYRICQESKCHACIFGPKNFEAMAKLFLNPISERDAVIDSFKGFIYMVLSRIVRGRIRKSPERREILENEGEEMLSFKTHDVFCDLRTVVNEFSDEGAIEILNYMINKAFEDRGRV